MIITSSQGRTFLLKPNLTLRSFRTIGYSWFANSVGLAIDNMVSFTTVLANGTIVEVDSHSPDLFFALKGGFTNFVSIASSGPAIVFSNS